MDTIEKHGSKNKVWCSSSRECFIVIFVSIPDDQFCMCCYRFLPSFRPELVSPQHDEQKTAYQPKLNSAG